MGKKGVVYLKRITLIILVLLFAFSTITFAQPMKTYKVGNYFTVSFPNDWTTEYSSDAMIMSFSPSVNHAITVSVLPTSRVGLKDPITELPKMITNSKEFPAQLEENQSLYIDGQKATLLIHSTGSPTREKNYWLMCFSDGEQYSYTISGYGKYAALETDRKTIDEIISSIKILK